MIIKLDPVKKMLSAERRFCAPKEPENSSSGQKSLWQNIRFCTVAAASGPRILRSKDWRTLMGFARRYSKEFSHKFESPRLLRFRRFVAAGASLIIMSKFFCCRATSFIGTISRGESFIINCAPGAFGTNETDETHF